MPRYEYKCEGCGEIFELQQKFADEPLTVHDKCGAKVERLISAPALQFKGSGWYVNDYAKGGNGGAKKSEGDSKSESKSDSKSESKTDSKSAGDSGSKSESKSTESKPASTSSSEKSKSD
jgi:putative FmdB family regulatory protein